MVDSGSLVGIGMTKIAIMVDIANMPVPARDGYSSFGLCDPVGSETALVAMIAMIKMAE